FMRIRESEASRATQRPRNVLDDAPVLPGVAGRINALIDLDDAPLDLRDGALVLFVERSRQYDLGMAGRLAEKEVDGDVKVQLVEHAADELIVRQRDLGVEADRQQAVHFAAVDLAENLVGIDARSRQVVRRDAPDFSNLSAVFGLGD